MSMRSEIRVEATALAGLLAPSQVQQQTIDSLFELNGKCLELLAEQSIVKFPQVRALTELGELCRRLDATARARAAACPFLFLDAGLADMKRWCGVYEGPRQNDVGPFFTVDRSRNVARQVVIFAWHLAQSNGFDAQLLLGMPDSCSGVIGACTLSQIHEIADRSGSWLTLRWPDRAIFWRQLLLAAASGEFRALETVRLHGLQLMAADALSGMKVES